MPSELLGVHGGRSYGPSPRGKSTPGPAVKIKFFLAPAAPGAAPGAPLQYPETLLEIASLLHKMVPKRHFTGTRT
jgi:hypothetical protein